MGRVSHRPTLVRGVFAVPPTSHRPTGFVPPNLSDQLYPVASVDDASLCGEIREHFVQVLALTASQFVPQTIPSYLRHPFGRRA